PGVARSAPRLAPREDERVVEHPAEALLTELRELGVLARPREREPRGVDVRHLGARRAREQARDARVAEQVEDARAVPRALETIQHPAPVRRLLGEDAHVLEGRRARPEARALEGERPAVGHTVLGRALPAPAAVRLAHEHEVGALPLARAEAPPPQRLGVRTDEHDLAEALELLAL